MNGMTRRPRAALAAGCALVVGLLAGCQGAGAPNSEVTSEPLPAASVAVSVPSGATEVSPKQDVNVAVTGGTLTDITLTGADGAAVTGTMSPDKTFWHADGQLAVQTVYTVKGSAENANGKATAISETFTTVTPADTETAFVQPKSGETVGVGMPIIVHFDAKVLDRAEVERRLTVTSNPAQEGSWAWASDKEVQYRTRDYWQPGTQVSVTANMTGIEFAGNVWGVDAPPTTFTVGRSQIIKVDIADYHATVEQNGTVIHTFPVSNGRGATGKYATRTGNKVIMTRERSHRMKAPGLGEDDPEYYDQVVQYAMRVTNSGEFLHAAPWSVGSQGRANVSHGCTNLSTANARWIYENSLIGDPVNYINGRRPLNQGNGWAMWNVSYDEWKQGSALAAPTPTPAAGTASPSASPAN